MYLCKILKGLKVMIEKKNIEFYLGQKTPEAMLELIKLTYKRYKKEDFNFLMPLDFINYLNKKQPEILENKPFVFIDSSIALECLTCYLIIIALNSDCPEANFNRIISWIEPITDSNLPMINETDAQKVMDLVGNMKAKKIIKNNSIKMPFRTFFVPFRLGKFNSMYLPDLNITMLGRVKTEEGTTAEYVYLHEIGHALHICLTDDFRRIPKTFIPIFEIAFNNKFDKVAPEDIPEVFADCFAVAAVYQTDYATLVPSFNFRLVDQEILSEYFKMLCKQPRLANDYETFWSIGRRNRIQSIVNKYK